MSFLAASITVAAGGPVVDFESFRPPPKKVPDEGRKDYDAIKGATPNPETPSMNQLA